MTEPNRDNWETPRHVVDAVSQFMGSPPIIDLCASPHNKKAERFIGATEVLGGPLEDLCAQTLANECRHGDWCWINPPYSRSAILSISRWIAKAAQAGCTIVMLVNIDKSTEWYRAVAPFVQAELVPSTRIQFIPPAGVKPSRNSKMQSLLVVAPRKPWSPPAGIYPSIPITIKHD